jgi:hypothetical protein
MSDVPEWVVYAITRVRSRFASEINAPRTGEGTAFVVDCGGWNALVTNRHVVDLSYRLNSTEWTLDRLDIQFRHADGDSHAPEVDFVSLNLERSKFAYSPDADVVAIGMSFDADNDLTSAGIHIDNLADDEFLRERAKMMDLASFIGFAGSKSVRWWDERWSTPIARIASLASTPSRPFYNSKIKSADVGLVSGLSFAGSSGSPLFVHAKGQANMSVANASYQAPKLIGVMSGHWELDNTTSAELFPHSGLSYYTRATSIRDVIGRLAAMRR